MTLLHRKPNNRGWTIIELMMVVAMIGFAIPALISLFSFAFRGMASAEIHLSLKELNEQMMLHLHEQLIANKHMFQDNSSSGGTTFISHIQMGSAPASVSFSQMPQAQSGTTITFSPASGAVSADFGDCLFYADYDSPQTINGVTYEAPITVSGVKNGSGNTVSVYLDVYRFYYDYLSSVGDMKPIPNMVSYWLIEWQSVQFVDAFELEDIEGQDTTLAGNVIKYLTTGSNFPSGKPVTYAWDPSQTAMTSGTSYAFYQLSSSSMTGESNETIPMQQWTVLSRVSSGYISPYNYGISGNYSNLAGDPPPPNVPEFAPYTKVANAFPGGFEVGIEGQSDGMQVMVRSLLIAHGYNKGILWDNETSITSCRDDW